MFQKKKGVYIPGEEKDSQLNVDDKKTQLKSVESLEDTIKKIDSCVEEQRIDCLKKSNENYHKLSSDIVATVKNNLQDQLDNKRKLRSIFAKFFTVLLSVQYIILILFILFKGFRCMDFNISDDMLKIYIISVFLETLSVIAAMIAFAFSSKDETNIINALSEIVKVYQKM